MPLIINDRIDIALAVGADGVHLGQTDMPINIARMLLPPGSIIGISCNDKAQVQKAVADGADYVGIGSIYSTQTKKLTSPIVGVRNVGELLDLLNGTTIKAVAIGRRKSKTLPNLSNSQTQVASNLRTLFALCMVQFQPQEEVLMVLL